MSPCPGSRSDCRRAALLLAPALLLSLLSLGCSARRGEVRTLQVFTVPCTVTLYDHASDAAFKACFDRLTTLDRELSMWVSGSGLDRINAASGQHPVAASADIRALLRQGLELAKESDGRFDPSIGPLVRLWAIGAGAVRPPSPEAIRRALALVNWRDVLLDEGAGTVFLRRRGMALDFGALAKGYAAVEAGKVLESFGVRAAVLDLGGCVVVLGSASGGRPWKVGIQDPAAPRGSLLGVLEASDSEVDTSGVYERFFMADGRRYHHLLDTRSGYPIDNGIVSATVVSPKSRNADGPSLAVFALGPAEGLALAERDGLGAILVGSDRTVWLTAGLAAHFTLTATGYTVVAR